MSAGYANIKGADKELDFSKTVFFIMRVMAGSPTGFTTDLKDIAIVGFEKSVQEKP
jgi:hypothetical protein